MRSYHCRARSANELDIKGFSFDCQELTILLAANSRDVVLACLTSEAIKTHFEHSPVLSERVAPREKTGDAHSGSRADFAANKKDAKLSRAGDA